MRSATSTPVYTSSEEANGHVVVFDVGMQDFYASRIFDANARNLYASRIAIRLPEPCKLFDESFEPDLIAESTFSMSEGKHLQTTNGHPSSELLAAAEVVANYMGDPTHEKVGLRVRSTNEGTILIAYLSTDLDIQLLCEEIAEAVYEKVAAVTFRHGWLGSMSYFENRDWQDYQLRGY